MSAARARLDERLVTLGAAGDVEAARQLVEGGVVLVDGAPARSPARIVPAAARVEVLSRPRFVSRGGEKLDACLGELGVDPEGLAALDVGSSTGGFTDCLLVRGARRVLAVDVGRHQLHERIGADPRVVALEETNVLDLPADRVVELLGEPASILTVDVAFTSLTRLVDHVVTLAAPGAWVVALVKPQFEADRALVSRGRGVVRDPAVWRSVLERCTSAIERAGAGIIGVVASPLPGAAGNREFFVAARVGAAPSEVRVELVARAVEAVP